MPTNIITKTPKLDRETANKIFDLRDTSPATTKDYKACVRLFLDFVEAQGFNSNIFLDFKRYLADRNDLSASSKNKYLATASIFLKEISRQSGLPDLTIGIKSFSQSKKHKKDGLNDDDINKLSIAIQELPNNTQNDRLKAVLSLLIFQGLRQIEIVRLDVLDIDFTAKTALVRGKGRDDKESINLHPETIKALKTYLESNKIADGALFTSQSNYKRNQRLTTRGLRNIIKQTLNSLEIMRSVHGFRHYFTSKLIKVYKADLTEVARLTRHKSIETLQIYNDTINAKADLPRFYGAFNGISL